MEQLAQIVADHPEATIPILLVAALFGLAYLVRYILEQDAKRYSALQEQSDKREERLMDHNNRLIDKLQGITDEIARMWTGFDHRLANVENDVKEIREKVG